MIGLGFNKKYNWKWKSGMCGKIMLAIHCTLEGIQGDSLTTNEKCKCRSIFFPPADNTDLNTIFQVTMARNKALNKKNMTLSKYNVLLSFSVIPKNLFKSCIRNK